MWQKVHLSAYGQGPLGKHVMHKVLLDAGAHGKEPDSGERA